MLQLPVIALEQRIKQELEVNPMLEELLDGLQEAEQEFEQEPAPGLTEQRSESTDEREPTSAEDRATDQER